MTRTLLPSTASKVASPNVLLPLVGCSAAVARAASWGVLWHAATRATAASVIKFFIILLTARIYRFPPTGGSLFRRRSNEIQVAVDVARLRAHRRFPRGACAGEAGGAALRVGLPG